MSLLSLLAVAACSAPPAIVATEVVPRLVGADSVLTARTTAAIERVDPDAFGADTFSHAAGPTIRYRLLRPPRVEREARYPFVVVFHGAGEIGTDNLTHLDRFSKAWARPEVRQRLPAFVLAPQMPERSALCSGPAESPGRHSRPGPPLHTALTLRQIPGAEVRCWEVDGLWHAVPPRLLAGMEVMERRFTHRR